MLYGQYHEKDALRFLKEELKLDVKPSGFFVDTEFGYLGATPDGLIGEEGIIEIKCPHSCENLTPYEAIESRKFTFWNFDKKEKAVGEINRRHRFFFQVQGQLHITNRLYCIFVLWTKKEVKTVRIEKDDTFWKSHMEEKLKAFYLDCLLPELIDPRHPRSMPIRNPAYILEAQRKKKDKQEKK